MRALNLFKIVFQRKEQLDNFKSKLKDISVDDDGETYQGFTIPDENDSIDEKTIVFATHLIYDEFREVLFVCCDNPNILPFSR